MSLQGFCLKKKKEKRNQKHLEDTKRSVATKKVALNKSKFKNEFWYMVEGERKQLKETSSQEIFAPLQ